LKLIALDERADMRVCLAAIEALIEAGDVTDDLASVCLKLLRSQIQLISQKPL
jgi:hypothetical protein